jgi:hypothetical protein
MLGKELFALPLRHLSALFMITDVIAILMGETLQNKT